MGELTVRATKTGYYDNRLRGPGRDGGPGEPFTLRDEADFTDVWMVKDEDAVSADPDDMTKAQIADEIARLTGEAPDGRLSKADLADRLRQARDGQ